MCLNIGPLTPENKTVDIYENKDGKMEKTAAYKKENILKSNVLKGFELEP